MTISVSATIGVSLSTTEVRAVLLRRRRVVWQGVAMIDAGRSPGDALADLMTQVPRRRWHRVTVTVAVGPRSGEYKVIDGLPPIRQGRLVSPLVRENAAAFFLRRWPAMVVSDAELRTTGGVWAAAFDGDLADAVLSVTGRVAAGRAQLVPWVVALARANDAGDHCAVVDGVCLELRSEAVGGQGARVVEVRRRVARPDDGSTTIDHAHVAALGAGLLAWRAPGTWQPVRDTNQRRSRARLRLVASGVAFALLMCVGLLLPPLRARRRAAAAAQDIAGIGTLRADQSRIERSLRDVTSQLDQLRRLNADRGRLTLLLGELSRALPESTAIVSLRVDSLDGSFVAVTPRAADILPELRAVHGITTPRIVGAVIRESMGPARVERATVRFRRSARSTTSP